MNELVFDVEASGATNGTKGNPFTPSNRMCCLSYHDGSDSDVLPVEYTEAPYGDRLREFAERIRKSDILVGFNIKYDLHWLKRYGINFRNKQIWDTQLAYFIMTHQRNPHPSLHGVGMELGEGEKIDIVKKEYWEKGIDTPDVPWDILYEYALNDADLTWKIYQHQQKELSRIPKLRNLIHLHCQDLLVTQEMEYNGIRYNMDLSRQKSRELDYEITRLTEKLKSFTTEVEIDPNSKDHLSALLYGGIVKKDEREQYEFVYKDGRKAIKERWIVKEYLLPRRITPLERTEYKKGGYFETNEKVLNLLHASGEVRDIINTILERNKLAKLQGTYYEGIPKLYSEMQWENQTIHGQLNHCVAGTGRLASSKPNQQNLDERVQVCIETRF
jgi:DNA polymerase-1